MWVTKRKDKPDYFYTAEINRMVPSCFSPASDGGNEATTCRCCHQPIHPATDIEWTLLVVRKVAMGSHGRIVAKIAMTVTISRFE